MKSASPFWLSKTSSHVRHLIDIASGVINGKPNALDHRKAMELHNNWKNILSNKTIAPENVADSEMEEQDNGPSMSQNSIDALFD